MEYGELFHEPKASEITSTMTSVVSDLSYTKCHSLAQMNDMSFIRTHSAQKNTQNNSEIWADTTRPSTTVEYIKYRIKLIRLISRVIV